MTEKVEFSDDEIKNVVNAFEPLKTKAYLNDLLTVKIASIIERVEEQMTIQAEIKMKQKYCPHKKIKAIKIQESILCDECEKVWK